MIVATSDLTKRYGETLALDAVSVAVPHGSVFGLVGPNGAGKTTLLAILAGLRRATAGSVELDAPRVGVLPDTPRFDPWLTGREVVELSAALGRTSTSSERIDDVLHDAGLEEAEHRRVSGYSRGMLQRLGLAATVVSDPDLLLLDEPAAALDPAGRREVLDLVARLRGRATVVFSSHILDDVQEVCDLIGILRTGELVYQGDLDGLLEGRLPRARYVVEVRDNPAALADRLSSIDWVSDATVNEARHVIVEADFDDDIERRLIPALAPLDLAIVSITPLRMTLEEVFLELTQ